MQHQTKTKSKEVTAKKKKFTNVQKGKHKSEYSSTIAKFSEDSKSLDKISDAISVPPSFSHLKLPNQTLIHSTSIWYQSPLNDKTDTTENSLKYADILKEYAVALHLNEIKKYKAKSGQDISNNKWVQTAASVGELFCCKHFSPLFK